MEAQRITLNRALDRWIAETKSTCTASTRDGLVATLAEVRRAFGKLDVSAVTEKALSGFLSRRRGAGWGANYTRRMLTTLRSFFAWAVKEQLLTENPAANKALMPKEAMSKRRAFSQAQYVAVLERSRAIEDERRPWTGELTKVIQVCWHTGLRSGDAMCLRWPAIDLRQRIILAKPLKKAALAQRLEIPMVEALAEMFYGIQAEDRTEFVFPWLAAMYLRGERNTIIERFRKLCRETGLGEGYSLHSLRHGFVSRLINAGVQTMVIGSITGQSAATVEKYAHVTMDAKMNALRNAAA